MRLHRHIGAIALAALCVGATRAPSSCEIRVDKTLLLITGLPPGTKGRLCVSHDGVPECRPAESKENGHIQEIRQKPIEGIVWFEFAPADGSSTATIRSCAEKIAPPPLISVDPSILAVLSSLAAFGTGMFATWLTMLMNRRSRSKELLSDWKNQYKRALQQFVAGKEPDPYPRPLPFLEGRTARNADAMVARVKEKIDNSGSLVAASKDDREKLADEIGQIINTTTL